MSITINDNLSVNAPKPTESRYLNESTLTVYPNVTAVNTSIVPSRRYLGLTVLIAEGGQNVEYWYKNGINDSDLVLKQAGGGASDVDDLTTDSGAAFEMLRVQADGTGLEFRSPEEVRTDIGAVGFDDVLPVLIKVKNENGPLTKGTPVYITGSVGDTDVSLIAAARADDPTKIASALLSQNLNTNGVGTAHVIGSLLDVNTSGYSEGSIYLAPTGGFTNTKPNDPAHVIQWLGVIERVNVNTGVIGVNVTAPQKVDSVDPLPDSIATRDSGGNLFVTGITRVDPNKPSNIAILNAYDLGLVSDDSINTPRIFNIAGGTALTDDRFTTVPNASGVLALTGRTDGTPDNLIPASGNISTIRTNLGLGTTNDVSFNSVTVDGAGGFYLSGLQAWTVFNGFTGINFRSESNSSIPFVVGYSGARLNGSSTLSWSQTSTAGTDLFLARDAANTLAQRNGTNAQTFRLYNTYTDPANYERLRLSAVSGSNFILGTEKGSAGGTARGLQIRTDSETNAEFPVTGGITTPFIKVTGTTADSSSGLKFLDSATSRYVDLKMASTLAADAIVRLPVVSGTLRVSASEIFTGTGGADSAATVTNGVDYYFSSAQSASGLLYTPATPSAGDVIEFTIDNRTGGAGPEQNVLIYQLSPLTLVATVPAGFRRVVLSYNGTSWSSSVTKATALTSRTDGVPDNIIPNNAATTRTNLGLGTTDSVQFGKLTVASGTSTANSPILDLSQTWNNSGVAFTGIFANITDTGSSNLSNLIDIRLNNVTRLLLNKDGTLRPSNSVMFGGDYVAMNSSGYGVGAGKSVNFTAQFGWSATEFSLIRDDANVLAQRGGTNAQTFRLYRTYTSASSYQRLTLSTTADAFNFTAESTSTSNLDLNLLPQGTGKTKTTNLDATGDITASGGAGEVDINSLYGSGMQFRSVEAVVNTTTGTSSAIATGLIPAGAIVMGVVVRVNTAITGPTTFAVGDGTTADRWGTGILLTAGTTTSSSSFVTTSLAIYPSATNVVLTASGGNFTTGAVRVCVHYLQISQLTA